MKNHMDRTVQWSTIAAVMSVAGIAAYVSYEHAAEFAATYGERGISSYAVPLTVDGLIYASSMVLLQAARQGRRASVRQHWLAYLGLFLGIGATGIANAAHGIAHGHPGIGVAVWPAVALIVSYELLMLMIRKSAVDQAEPEPAEVAEVALTLPEALARVVDGGMSRRQIADELAASRDKVSAMVRQARPPVEQVAEPPLSVVSEQA